MCVFFSFFLSALNNAIDSSANRRFLFLYLCAAFAAVKNGPIAVSSNKIALNGIFDLGMDGINGTNQY